MARWKKAASVQGDGPRAWLLAKRREQLRKVESQLAAVSTHEFIRYLSRHRDRRAASIRDAIRRLEAGEPVQVSRWEFPKHVDLPGTANQYEITAGDTIVPLTNNH